MNKKILILFIFLITSTNTNFAQTPYTLENNISFDETITPFYDLLPLSPPSPQNSQPTEPELKVDNYDWGPYMRNIQRTIKANWHPEEIKSNKSKKVVVEFGINKDGSVFSPKIYKTSGDEDYDNRAINTIKNIKFLPLPAASNKNDINIQFTFDYNNFCGSKK